MSIIPEGFSLRDSGLDNVIIDIIRPYFGKTVKELVAEFSVNTKVYSVKSDIIKAIFRTDAELDESDEFKKANYRFRTITVNHNRTPTEDIPFPSFNFEELLKEKSWQDSSVFEEMIAPRFLFAIFSKNSKGKEILNNCCIWYIPNKDINKVKAVWDETKKIIKNGVILTQKISHDKKGNLMFAYQNNFPKTNYNGVAQVRNKANNIDYFGKSSNSCKMVKKATVVLLDKIPDELADTAIPSGEYMTKQCFWFNKKYIKRQIEPHILKY
jgi:DNA mismatch repair protein MutH